MEKKPVLLFMACCCLMVPAHLTGAETEEKQGSRFPKTGWSTSLRGGVVQQFDTDMAEGGSFDATRFTIQAGQNYGWDYRTGVSVALGYSFDGYNFSGNTGLAAVSPWDDIHTVSLSVPMRWGINKDWSGYFVPTIRSTGEQGAGFGDSITGGGFAGASYRFGEGLVIGPGIGVISQLEESPTVFPILIINWKITERFSLETGGGLGATLGPGLILNYQADQRWKFSLGGRYEKLRFRLDKDGRIPDGIGEDMSFPLFGGVSYNFSPSTSISLIGGVETGGELRVEDKNGNLVEEESYDPGGFLGLTFAMRIQ